MPHLLRIMTYFVVTVFLTCAAFVSANASARKLFDSILAKLTDAAPVDNVNDTSSRKPLYRSRYEEEEPVQRTAFLEQLKKFFGGDSLESKARVALTLRVDADALLEEWLVSLQAQARRKIGEVKVDGRRIRRKRPKIIDGTVVTQVIDPAHTAVTETKLRELINTVSGAKDVPDIEVIAKDDGIVVLQPTDALIKARINRALETAVVTIGRRIKASGVQYYSVKRQGQLDIVVQVPVSDDKQQLRQLIGKIAKLTFQLVDESITAKNAQSEGVPIGSELVEDREIPGMMHLLKKKVEVSGDDLEYARGERDYNTHRPIISFGFNAAGTRKFAAVTKANIGRRFAVVLDNGTDNNGKRDRKVVTAPIIQSAILQGQGIITGRFSVNEANELAILLGSGILPAPLKVIKEEHIAPNSTRGPPSKQG